ncbi:hypothetical protein [Streptomyces sp. NPDC001348]
MRRALLPAVPVLLLALAACGTPSDTGSAAPTHRAPTTTPPQKNQDRSLSCGGTVERPVVSGPDDRLQLTVRSARRQGASLLATYSITSADRAQMLSLPIGEVPPTALLLKHGVITGRQKPAVGNGTVDGRPATGYAVGRHPYTKTLAIDALCPGTTWSDVDNDPGDYRTVVVMSVQSHGRPSTPASGSVHPLPLLEAMREIPVKDPGTR